MIVFTAAAAALVVVALLFLLPPLLRQRGAQAMVPRAAINASIYRDQLAELERDLRDGSLSQADFEQGRQELQRRLLLDTAESGAPAASKGGAARRSALALGIALPLAAALLYFALGSLPGLSPERARPEVTAGQIEDMVARLAARLEQNPDDLKGWIMLARSYKALGRYEESANAFRKAEKAAVADPQLLADYAEALAIATGGSLKGKPSELIKQALALDPDHPQALVLAGTAAYEREDFAAAAAYWEKLLDQLPPDSDDAKSISDSIRKARAAQEKKGRKASRGGPAAPDAR